MNKIWLSCYISTMLDNNLSFYRVLESMSFTHLKYIISFKKLKAFLKYETQKKKEWLILDILNCARK